MMLVFENESAVYEYMKIRLVGVKIRNSNSVIFYENMLQESSERVEKHNLNGRHITNMIALVE